MEPRLKARRAERCTVSCSGKFPRSLALKAIEFIFRLVERIGPANQKSEWSIISTKTQLETFITGATGKTCRIYVCSFHPTLSRSRWWPITTLVRDSTKVHLCASMVSRLLGDFREWDAYLNVQLQSFGRSLSLPK